MNIKMLKFYQKKKRYGNNLIQKLMSLGYINFFKS